MDEHLGGVPSGRRGLMILAGVVLVLPVVAMLWVGTYARSAPTLWGFPFFFWYQLLWVVLCAVTSYTAHRLLIAARRKDAR